ncbi:hypothetical protein T4E_3698 [Trichinella pseudospiralis]|uniref:Uncharacterized protein n=1 Tax=Trichinella pseudospiralis TaxID=6337 RepID=A0A0V0YCW9_TRIPS|nr:hypothetical protein T4E_3698 [Trichinella pseudospiralis]
MAFLDNKAILRFSFVSDPLFLLVDFEEEHLEVESDDEVFIYTSDESDAGSCTEEAVTESELENQYTSLNEIIWQRAPYAVRR